VAPFKYYHPSTLQKAVQLLSEPGAVAKMGGCDVMTRYRRGELDANALVALHRLPDMGEITTSPNGVRIGAAVTLRQLGMDADFRSGWPLIAHVAVTIASPAIRAWATVVGNIAQGWSVSDLVPLFEICDAELHLVGPSGERRLAVAEYAAQPGNRALKQGEIIAALLLPAPSAGLRMSYERFAFRQGFDLPLVSVAVGATVTEYGFAQARVAAAGGSRMPSRCASAEAVLTKGKNDDATVGRAASAIAEWAEPVSDFRASGDYRRQLLKVLLPRAIAKLRRQ
jgi:carbon-monoxide dehydrogenase medium subunit